MQLLLNITETDLQLLLPLLQRLQIPYSALQSTPQTATSKDIQMAAIADIDAQTDNDEYLSPQELDYYLNLNK